MSNRESDSSSSKGKLDCASCKYQHRKCPPDCPLAPYFPLCRAKDFENVHKHYGIRHILKLIRIVDPSKRKDAMESLIFEANARARDPIGGCLRCILELQRQLVSTASELQRVRHTIDLSLKNAVPSPFPMPPPSSHYAPLPAYCNNLQQPSETSLPFDLLDPVQDQYHGLDEGNYYFGEHAFLHDDEAVNVFDAMAKEDQNPTAFNLDPIEEKYQTDKLHSTGTVQSRFV